MRNRSLLFAAMAMSLLCAAGEALARSKKREKDEAAAATVTTETKSDPLVATSATVTTTPAAAPVVSGSAGATVTSGPVSPRDLLQTCMQMVNAAPDQATQRSILQTCSQQFNAAAPAGGQAGQQTAPSAPPPPPSVPPPAVEAPPPPDVPSAADRAAASAKAGMFMLNFRAGYVPPFSLGGGSGSSSFSVEFPPQALLGVEFGFSILPSRNAYLILPLQFQFVAQQATIMVPVGFQYDIALPIKNLFITPRFSLGYAAQVTSLSTGIPGVGSSTVVGHSGVAAPEIGFKYIFRGRMNLGMDLLSIPIIFSPNAALVFYRVNVFLGANF